MVNVKPPSPRQKQGKHFNLSNILLTLESAMISRTLGSIRSSCVSNNHGIEMCEASKYYEESALTNALTNILATSQACFHSSTGAASIGFLSRSITENLGHTLRVL